MQKEFGQLSGDQLLQLVQLLPEFEVLAREFRLDFRTNGEASSGD